MEWLEHNIENCEKVEKEIIEQLKRINWKHCQDQNKKNN